MALQCGQWCAVVLERNGGRRWDGASQGECSVKGTRADEGFSLIETILVVILMGMLSLIGLSSMSKFSARRNMHQGAGQLEGDLRLTQQFAVTQDQNFRLVYVPSSTSSYTIVKVSDGSVSKDILLPSSLTVTSTFTGNIAEFSPKGAPTQKGTFCVSASGVSTIMKIDVLAGTRGAPTQEGRAGAGKKVLGLVCAGEGYGRAPFRVGRGVGAGSVLSAPAGRW